jgi:hypothetical protein
MSEEKKNRIKYKEKKYIYIETKREINFIQIECDQVQQLNVFHVMTNQHH